MVNFSAVKDRALQFGASSYEVCRTTISLTIENTNQLIQDIWNSEWVKNEIRSINFIKYRIEPITKREGKIIGGCAATSAAVSIIALKSLGFIALPMVMAADSIILGGSYGLFAYRRLTQKYNEEAWDKLELLRHHIFSHTSPKEQNVARIYELIKELSGPQYSHQDEEVKNLEKEIKQYRSILVNNPEKKNFEEHRDALVFSIERFQQKLSRRKIEPLIKKNDPDKSEVDSKKEHKGDHVEIQIEEKK